MNTGPRTSRHRTAALLHLAMLCAMTVVACERQEVAPSDERTRVPGPDASPGQAPDAAHDEAAQPTLDRLAAIMEGEAGRVVATSEGEPIVVIVRDVPLHRWHPPLHPLLRGDTSQPGTANPTSERRARQQTVQLCEALHDGGVSIIATDTIDHTLDPPTLARLATGAPDLAGLLSEPPDERRASADRLLASPSDIPTAVVIAALTSHRSEMVGIDTPALGRRTLEGEQAMAHLQSITNDLQALVPMHRAPVLAGAANPAEVDGYRENRSQALFHLDSFEAHIVRTRAPALADATTGLAHARGARVIGLLATGLYADAIAAELTRRGVGTLLVEPRAYRQAVPAFDLWLASERAHLPPLPEARDPGDLPPLEPWSSVLAPLRVALANDERFADLRTAVDRPQPPVLAPDAPARRRVVEAAQRLASVGALSPTAASAIGAPLQTIETLELRGAPEGRHMAYDALHHRLKVADHIVTMTVDEVAVILAHELVHVRDTDLLAHAMGCSRQEVALTLDAMPASAGFGLQLTLEDRAFRVELEVARALGLELSDPRGEGAAGGQPGELPPSMNLRIMLSQLAAALPDARRWWRAVWSSLAPMR